MKKAELDLIMRQQIVLPETPRQRRELAALEEDLKSMDITGRPLRLRVRNFIPSAEGYLASAGGPLPYMLRLREIERLLESHQAELEEAWRLIAHETAEDPAAFAPLWRERAQTWSFGEVNDLIERHNRWYPVESRLPMDPRTGDYVLVNGRDYRMQPLDGDWVLERYPPELGIALAA